MDNLQITYGINTANRENIEAHLVNCNETMCPRLDKRVIIQDYAGKIHELAVTFEAWLDHTLVGLVAAYFNDMITKTGYITDVSVMKDYMGRGIASELMKMCIGYAKETDFRRIQLEVYKDNSSAIHLYRKFGFLEYSTRGDYMLMCVGLV